MNKCRIVKMEECLRVIVRQKDPTKVESGGFYRMVVRLSLLYGVKCWPIKKYQVQRIKIAKM